MSVSKAEAGHEEAEPSASWEHILQNSAYVNAWITSKEVVASGCPYCSEVQLPLLKWKGCAYLVWPGVGVSIETSYKVNFRRHNLCSVFG